MKQEKFSSLKSVKIKAESLQKKFRTLGKLRPLENNFKKKISTEFVKIHKHLPTLVQRLDKKINYCSASCIEKNYCENCLQTNNYAEDKSITKNRDKKVQELLLNFKSSLIRDKIKYKSRNNCIFKRNENSEKHKHIDHYINNYDDQREKAVSKFRRFQKLADNEDFFAKLQQAQNTSKKVSKKIKRKKNNKVILPPIRQSVKKPIELSKIDLQTEGNTLKCLSKKHQPNVVKDLENQVFLQSKERSVVLPRLCKKNLKRASMVTFYDGSNDWKEMTMIKPRHEILPDINSTFDIRKSYDKY